MNSPKSYTIYDAKAKAYMEPFYSLNDETAQRRFENDVNGEGLFGKFPEDFSLHSNGEFSYETGIHTEQIPIHICNAITLRDQGPGRQLDLVDSIPNTKVTTPNV